MNPKHAPALGTVTAPEKKDKPAQIDLFDAIYFDRSQRQIEQMRTYIEGLESRLLTATKSSIK
jgi:hypothetical protein